MPLTCDGPDSWPNASGNRPVRGPSGSCVWRYASAGLPRDISRAVAWVQPRPSSVGTRPPEGEIEGTPLMAQPNISASDLANALQKDFSASVLGGCACLARSARVPSCPWRIAKLP
jgi:hypothetical protein